MTVHMIKLCVGTDTVGDLAKWQVSRIAAATEAGTDSRLKHITRNTPKRAREVTDGGSLYWVVCGVIRVRQLITAIEPHERDDGRPACALILAPQLVRTQPRGFRAFQGWRYFPVEDAPPDIPKGFDADDVPADMAAELRGLGLI